MYPSGPLVTHNPLHTFGLCQVTSHSRESKCILGIAAICKVSKPRCSVVGELSFFIHYYYFYTLKAGGDGQLHTEGWRRWSATH